MIQIIDDLKLKICYLDFAKECSFIKGRTHNAMHFKNKNILLTLMRLNDGKKRNS